MTPPEQPPFNDDDRLLAQLNQVRAHPDRAAQALTGLARINQRLEESMRRPITTPGMTKWTSIKTWIPAVSALAVVVAMAATAYRMSHTDSPASQLREFVTPAGSRSTVVLHDGTRLVLGPDTRLRVPSGYGVTGRTVELSGEAAFTVIHDTKHPFAVRTPHALVRDIGTTFVIHAYPEDAEDYVTVEEGQVAVGQCSAQVCTSGAHTVALSRGDKAIASNEAMLVKHGVDLTAATLWIQGGLVFDNTPLTQVVQDIGRTFGVHVSVADSLLTKRHITATFTGRSLDVILDIVTQTLGARYERTPHGIVILSGTAATDHARPAHPAPLVTARSTISPE